MADVSTWTENGFTREQAACLEERFVASRQEQSTFDRQTLKWLFGGIVALGILLAGALYTEIKLLRTDIGNELAAIRTEIGSVRTEIGSVRMEIGSVRMELGNEIMANREVTAELAERLARIEGILLDRLPRNE